MFTPSEENKDIDVDVGFLNNMVPITSFFYSYDGLGNDADTIVFPIENALRISKESLKEFEEILIMGNVKNDQKDSVEEGRPVNSPPTRSSRGKDVILSERRDETGVDRIVLLDIGKSKLMGDGRGGTDVTFDSCLFFEDDLGGNTTQCDNDNPCESGETCYKEAGAEKGVCEKKGMPIWSVAVILIAAFFIISLVTTIIQSMTT
jgi:hypothetical protein